VTGDGNLSLQNGRENRFIVVLGEVLWDLFEDSRRLGGAPLNFAAHARRLGQTAALISAVGADLLGAEAAQEIAALGLGTAFLQQSTRFATGTARVQLGPGGRTSFVIERPAAYDAIALSQSDIDRLIQQAPEWLYYGTLFSSTLEGERVLCRLLDALPVATRFYDLNLRPGCYSEELVKRLLSRANVVKLNEEELEAVHEFTGLPLALEPFCREGAKRYGWKAVCVTLGAKGCAVSACGHYVEATGHAVAAIDPVGAGDAFAAAFLHGLISEWPAAQIAEFANRVGALVASRPGAIPDWTVEEAVAL
jgi:fructokinase